MRRSHCALLLASLLAGCGGHGGGASSGDVDAGDSAYPISPKQGFDALAHGELITATATVSVDDITFAVVGGDRNGTLSDTDYDNEGTRPPLAFGFDATTGTRNIGYLAPDRAGTFRIVATFLKGGQAVATRTAIIEVSQDVGYGV